MLQLWKKTSDRKQLCKIRYRIYTDDKMHRYVCTVTTHITQVHQSLEPHSVLPNKHYRLRTFVMRKKTQKTYCIVIQLILHLINNIILSDLFKSEEHKNVSKMSSKHRFYLA